MQDLFPASENSNMEQQATYGKHTYTYASQPRASYVGVPPRMGEITPRVLMVALINVCVFTFFALWIGMTIRNYRRKRYEVLERPLHGRDWIAARVAADLNPAPLTDTENALNARQKALQKRRRMPVDIF